MLKNVRLLVVGLIAVLVLGIAACGAQQQTVPPAAAPAASSGGNGGGEEEEASGVTVEIGIKGEELAFDKKELSAEVAEGEDLTVDFTNTSQTQEHNFILLNHNDMDEAEAFNDTASAAVDTAYYPEDDEEITEQVIAHIETLQPGESDTVTFEAPEAGEYLYVCTVPGHFAAGDWGTLTIE